MRKSATCSLNFVYLSLGVIAMAVIGWSLATIIPFRELLGNGFTIPQILFLLLTLLTVALAILGIVGYQKRSHKLTISFSTLIILTSILFVLVAVMIILELRKVRPVLKGRLQKLYQAYNDSADNDLYDSIQYNFGCCGYYNYTDWYYNTSQPGRMGTLIPLSCCQATGSRRHDVCRGAGNKMDYLSTDGCYSKGYKCALMGSLPVVITACIIAIMGITCSVLSFIESNRMRHESRDENDDASGSENEGGDDDD